MPTGRAVRILGSGYTSSGEKCQARDLTIWEDARDIRRQRLQPDANSGGMSEDDSGVVNEVPPLASGTTVTSLTSSS